ncbi:hypothetical protein Hte_008804 [Hypoxylon texense]
MQFKLLAVSFFAALALADDNNLSSIVDAFPDCSLPCLAQKAEGEGCKISDFGCVCDNQLKIAAKMGTCLSDYCGTLQNFDAGGRLGELCERWDDHPSSTEVAAATSALASQVTAASATITPNAAAGSLEPGMIMMGAAAAAALMI